MEDRLQQALDFANYRQTLNNQLQKLAIKSEGSLIYSVAGGNFTIDQQFICFLDYLVRSGYSEATLLDNNKTPISITDTSAMLKSATDRYFEVTNDYFREHQKLRKLRNVKSVLDLKGV